MAEYALLTQAATNRYSYARNIGEQNPLDSLYKSRLPITTLCQKLGKLLQVLLIRLIESIQDGAVNVNDCDDFVARYDGNHNLALALAVTRNVTGNFSTSSTSCVVFVAAAAPHTPRPNGIVWQATLPWNGPRMSWSLVVGSRT